MTSPEWVGYLYLDGAVEFVKLAGQLTAPATVRADLPNSGAFALGLELAGRDGELTGSLALPGTSLGAAAAAQLTGPLAGPDDPGGSGARGWAGRLTVGGRPGTFALYRVVTWDLATYRGLLAEYQVGGRRLTFHLSADEWLGGPFLFYSERDRLVRLYPDETGRLLSEDADVLTLTADRRGIESAARIGGDDQAVPVSRPASWSEEDVSTSGPAGNLAGTLLLPPGSGPRPAIVLIHGAAGGLRDFYRAYAEPFVRGGMAALVYDKRGYGGSAGDRDISFADKSLDAEAWVDYLEHRPDIRADRVGVWGFSNGSWVAPMVAARRPDVAFLAVAGAAGVTAVETEIHRRVFDLREQGVPADQLDQVAELWGLVYDLILSRRPDPDKARRFDELTGITRASAELAGVRIQDYAVAEPFLGPLPPFRRYQEIVDQLPEWESSDTFGLDPADSYARLRVPVLFLVGDQDSNLPGLRSAQRVSQTLHQAGNHDATVVVFPGTGHLMNLVEVGSDTGMTSEEAGYRLHHFRFAGGFTDIVRCWAAGRAAD